MDSIFIILLNFNNPQLTIDCVNSIKDSTYSNYSIVIVDNASTDNSFEVLTTSYKNDPMVNLIKSSVNNGFSAGNNVGIKFALENGADYIMLLNNDTIIDKEMIPLLLLKANENTVTVPKMLYFSRPDVVWYAGGEINNKKGQIKHYGFNKRDSQKYSKERNCSFATGCCMLIHKKIIERIGLLDESFFLYCEDAEYSLRLTQNNVTIKYVPTAKLWHKVGASSKTNKNVIYYDTRNMLYFMDICNFPLFAKIKYRTIKLLLYFRGILTNSNDKLYRRAYCDYRIGVKGKVNL